MSTYVLPFTGIARTQLNFVGGKAANLGELSRLNIANVPDGFCLTTEAYKKITAKNRALNDLIKNLSRLSATQREDIGIISASIRRLIERTPIPKEITEAVASHLEKLGEKNAFAIRSSATAEDLPTASFAGQQDTYLNIQGMAAILTHIGKCWASLFTDRAVIYRIRNGFDHRHVYLCVIVQKMVFPQVSGILFTADPVTSNRKVTAIDAGFGLGEALVSGRVSADSYKVSGNKVIDKRIAKQDTQILTDRQIFQLTRLGRQIETHFGCPQDIEWALADSEFYILQSRPITTLYPIPKATDGKSHVYVSVGHQQMMTDPMKPLGLSLFQLTAGRPMFEAGGRLFVDVGPDLASPAGRKTLIDVLGKSDPLIGDALQTILAREDFIKPLPLEEKSPDSTKVTPPTDFQTLIDFDPAIVHTLIARFQSSLTALKQTILTKDGPQLIDFIGEDIRELKRLRSDPQSFGVIMTAMNAASWINENMKEWLGEKNAADTLSQSVPNNVTSEMGLELLAVADVIRPHPEVIGYLQQVKHDNFMDELPKLNGGRKAHDAIAAFLDKYGMRCVGEIDITKTRWSENPAELIPIILSNIKHSNANDGYRGFDQGRKAAIKKEQELLDRLIRLPDGEQKAKETKRMIGLIRSLSGYREYPKYHIVNRYFVYKQALAKEAQKLVQTGVLNSKDDIYFLTFEELRELLHTKKPDPDLIGRKKTEFSSYERLSPPRVFTSDGEIISGRYKREDLPAKGIAGLPVSSGIIEGPARVIFRIEDAHLEEGDILVTPFTDPSWTPLFLSIKGLVTEVGGLMTHGAVIAREYGLPAVVGVENATRLIEDGQRIRVNGTDGYVEIL